jgi:hypothetical protein
MTENSLEQGQVAAADIALSSPEIDSRLDAMLADMDAEDAAAEENTASDNPPIGIILSRQKDELLVEYATYGMNSQLFVQQYQLYLPEREALKAEIERTLLQAGQ